MFETFPHIYNSLSVRWSHYESRESTYVHAHKQIFWYLNIYNHNRALKLIIPHNSNYIYTHNYKYFVNYVHFNILFLVKFLHISGRLNMRM